VRDESDVRLGDSDVDATSIKGSSGEYIVRNWIVTSQPLPLNEGLLESHSGENGKKKVRCPVLV